MLMAPMKRAADVNWDTSRQKYFKLNNVRPLSSYARNGRTYNPSGRYAGRSNRGPYSALTYGDRHQNPIYPTPEVKYTDIGQDGNGFAAVPAVTPIGTTASIACLNQITAGTGVNQRIGSQITVRNCSYRFELDLPNPAATPTGVPVPTSGRVILIWDKQSNAALPTFTQIFNVNNYLSFIQPGAVQRFTILRNQQFSLSPNGDQTLFFEGFCRINMRTTYSSGAIPNSGALLLVLIGDQTTATQQPTISGCWRTRYLDN